MSDLPFIQAASPSVIIGADPTGTETYPVASSSNGELRNTDCVNTSATDSTVSLTTAATEVKVGASRLTDRKYVWMQALVSNVKWGFDSNCRFNLFKNQMVCFPIGNVPIYIKMSAGTGTANIGEGA